MGSTGDATVLLPVQSTDVPSRDVAMMIFNGLLKYDKDAGLTGNLAESCEVLEGGRRIRFHLRGGVKWQDGTPFTSRDVEFNYRVYIDPCTPTPWDSDFLKVQQVRCLNHHIAEATYEKPYAPALESGTEGLLPRHLREDGDITRSPRPRNAVGTGPYCLEDWTASEKIKLRAIPDFYPRRPFLDEVTIRIIPDQAAMFLLLRAGELDRPKVKQRPAVQP